MGRKAVADNMKKIFLIIVCLAAVLFCGCESKEQNKEHSSMSSKSSKKTAEKNTVTFINGIQDSDVWILADTKENKKTTLWGKAAVSKIKTGESRKAPLCEPGDDGLYILRMIDTDSFYYSADGIKLEADWTVEVKEDDSHYVTAEVKDKNGRLVNTYEVFSARL